MLLEKCVVAHGLFKQVVVLMNLPVFAQVAAVVSWIFLNDFGVYKSKSIWSSLRDLGFSGQFSRTNANYLATWIRSWEAYFSINSCFFPDQWFNHSEKSSLNKWLGKCVCSTTKGLCINFRLALQRLKNRSIILLGKTAAFETRPLPGLLHSMPFSPVWPCPGF